MLSHQTGESAGRYGFESTNSWLVTVTLQDDNETPGQGHGASLEGSRRRHDPSQTYQRSQRWWVGDGLAA